MKTNSSFGIIHFFYSIYVKYTDEIKTGLAVFTVLWMMPIRLSNILAVILIPVFLNFFKKQFNLSGREKSLALEFSLFFAFCLLLGNLDFTQKFVVGVWDLAFYRTLVFLGWWCIFYHLIESLLYIHDQHMNIYMGGGRNILIGKYISVY